MSEEFSFLVTDTPDTDDVYIEVSYGDAVLADVWEDSSGDLRLRLYPPTDQPHWELGLEDLESAIATAREKWRSLGPKRP